MAHTPGPWMFDRTAGGEWGVFPEQDDKRADAENVVTECRFLVAGDNAEADARLIAAAPDLLAVAELVLKRWKGGRLDEAVRELQRAVDKAKGQ